MAVRLNDITLEKFKAYNEKQSIDLSDINILMGANSSGKSSCIQSLLALKQTCESGQEHIGLLLNGKYVTLGSFSDVVNEIAHEKDHFAIQMGVEAGKDEEAAEKMTIRWEFGRNDEFINGVELRKIEFSEASNISIQLEENNQYSVLINGKRQKVKAELNNMFVSYIIFPYDREYDKILQDFIKETINWICGLEKNIVTIKKDILVSSQITRLSTSLFSKLQKQPRTSNAEEHFGKAATVFSHIMEMLRRQDDSLDESQAILFLPSMLMKDLDYRGFDEIWERYKGKKPGTQEEYVSYNRISLEQFLSTRAKGKKGDIKLWPLIKSYNEFVRKLVSGIRYLGPLRENPKSLYQWDIDIDPNYVGTRGEHFPSVLTTIENKPIMTMLPDFEKQEEILFSDALGIWCQYLKVASEIHVDSSYSFGMYIRLNNINDSKSYIMNVGIGTSQVLQVLIMGLISPDDSILIYEQPELHLHPYSQSRLVDFFIAMSKLGKQIIIETHSEYMLHRFRYHLLKGRVQEDKVCLNFFANKEEGTFVYAGRLGKNGEIDYPKDFVDQNQSLFFEMLNAKEN